jgi:DNA repair protein RadA/Sms
MRTTPYECRDCGHQSPRWFGRCPECGGWASADAGHAAGRGTAGPVVTLSTGTASAERIPTGLDEVDRVLGGGCVAGEVVLLAGEPGIGKSTLVLQLMSSLLAADVPSLLVSGEESIDQVALRAARLGARPDRLRAAAIGDLAQVITTASAERARVLIVDSVQTLADPDADGPPGSVAQVRECASALARFAKLTDVIVILVGHVTKDGAVAGPKTLEHLVDAVLLLDGERSGTLRLLRATKNRFGPCDETGVFTMNGHGLVAVADPSSLLLSDRRPGVAGSIVFPCLEGSRPVLVEVQALVTKSDLSHARRVAIGLDSRRLTLMLGVMSRDASSSFTSKDVFAAAAGGLSVKEPAADLPLCLAALSAERDVPLDPEVVAIGEVGLGGEVRKVPGVERRLAEAARLGFRCALVPHGQGSASDIETREVDELAEAFGYATASSTTYASQGSA